MSKVNDVYIIGNNAELYNTVREHVSESFQLHHIEASELKKHDVQIALVMKTEGEPSVDVAQHVLSEFPHAVIIYINDEQDFELLRDLTRLGVSEHFVFPDEEMMFLDRIHAIAGEIDTGSNTAAEGFKRGGGKVFAFYSGKGGTGKSLVSTTFAQTLKLESTAKVLYIDLNLQYGGAETFLGIDSSRSIIDLIPVIHELSEHHIRNIAEKEPNSNLEVLVSPRDAEMAEKIDEDFILRLIRASKRSYDFIVVDLPSWMEERVFTVLGEAHRIYYVMNLDTPAIRVLKSVENLFQQLGIITDERMELVINLIGKDNELTKKDIERFVTYPVTVEIRRDLKGVQPLINQGLPLRKEPEEKKLTPVAKDIQKWVRSMLK